WKKSHARRRRSSFSTISVHSPARTRKASWFASAWYRPVCPGSRTVRLIPSWSNSIGGSPYSFSKAHLAPLVSVTHHSASRALTTNQPSVTGVSPDPESSSRASGTDAFCTSEASSRRPVSTARWDRRLLEHVPRSSESKDGRHPIQGERPDVSGPANDARRVDGARAERLEGEGGFDRPAGGRRVRAFRAGLDVEQGPGRRLASAGRRRRGGGRRTAGRDRRTEPRAQCADPS